MLKKIHIVILSLLINYLTGCIVHKTERIINLDESLNQEIIKQAVLKSGDVITFNDNGGTAVYIEEGIKGNINKMEHFYSLADIKVLRNVSPKPVTKENAIGKKIAEVQYGNGKFIRFNEAGAEIIAEDNIVRGVTEYGLLRSYDLSSIREIYIQPDTLDRRELRKDSSIAILQAIQWKPDKVITFDKPGAHYFSKARMITGNDALNQPAAVDLNDVLYVNVERVNTGGSILATTAAIAGIGAAVVLVIAATKQSCPFIYSYDGAKYIFDAEPLGGAITKGLERQEYSKLEFLKPVDNKYNLLIRNEVEETQHLNNLSLLVFDHSPNSEIFEDCKGNFREVFNEQQPISASDEKGNDLRKFLMKEDSICWQTAIPVEPKEAAIEARHQITLKFPKPAGIRKANLIVKGGTSLWGSRMIREMTSLRGSQLDEWYNNIDNKEIDYSIMTKFLEQEELYNLKVYLKEKGQWNPRAEITGCGPLILEKRIIPLDLSNTEDGDLSIRINPPMGFWSFDQFSIEYGNKPAPEGKEIKISTAYAAGGREEATADLLKDGDNAYYDMPVVGESFKVSFDVPEQNPDTKRTVFVKTSGWYEMHIDKTKPPELTKLFQFGMKPGGIVEYAMEKFIEWKNNPESKIVEKRHEKAK